jgi:hypothetical protein
MFVFVDLQHTALVSDIMRANRAHKFVIAIKQPVENIGKMVEHFQNGKNVPGIHEVSYHVVVKRDNSIKSSTTPMADAEALVRVPQCVSHETWRSKLSIKSLIFCFECGLTMCFCSCLPGFSVGESKTRL